MEVIFEMATLVKSVVFIRICREFALSIQSPLHRGPFVGPELSLLSTPEMHPSRNVAK